MSNLALALPNKNIINLLQFVSFKICNKSTNPSRIKFAKFYYIYSTQLQHQWHDLDLVKVKARYSSYFVIL